MGNEQMKASLEQIIAALKWGGDWELVDKNLDPNSLDTIDAAKELANNESADLRDLAYTIWQTTDTKMPDEIRQLALEEILKGPEDEEDSGRYARFRAAFALLKNGDNSEIVIKTIEDAAKDQDTSEIASKFLRNLNSHEILDINDKLL